MRGIMKKLSVGLAMVLCLSMVAAPVAEACTIWDIIVIRPDGTAECYIIIYIIVIDEGRAMLSIPGYETVASHGGHAAAMDACAVGMSTVPGVSKIEHAGLYSSDSGKLLYSFDLEASLRDDFSVLAIEEGLPATKWTSLYTDQVPEGILDGMSAHFNLIVTLEKGTTVEDLAKQLEKNGIFATSAANSDLTLNPDHYTVLPVSEVKILVPPVEAAEK